MLETSYGATFSNLMSIAYIIVGFFNEFFRLLTTDVWTLINNAPIPKYVFDALSVLKIDAFLSQFSLIGLLFTMVIVYMLIIYFFIP